MIREIFALLMDSPWWVKLCAVTAVVLRGVRNSVLDDRAFVLIHFEGVS